MTLGRISSEESMGLVDGPGIRYVVFLQGCQLRCKYCHNPETWDMTKPSFMLSADELIKKVLRFKPYFGSKGGITFSGGEPLLQPDFLKECLALCKENSLHTVIDTAGVGISDEMVMSEILSLCDLVILDIKSSDEEKYRELTGQPMTRFKNFLSLTQKLNKKLWLRQVIVPGLNDNEENIEHLANFIKPIKNVERIELLPYKSLGESKYKTLKIKYPLEGLENMDEERCKNLERKLHQILGRTDF